MNWISVKDRLPEDGESVLVFSKREGGVFKAASCYGSVCEESSLSIESELILDVTHWMPLPDGPKEEE